jgi:hypothetical protein
MAASRIVHFKAMKRMVKTFVRQKRIENVTVEYEHTRRLANPDVISVVEEKKYQLVLRKARLARPGEAPNEFCLVPFGYAEG